MADVAQGETGCADTGSQESPVVLRDVPAPLHRLLAHTPLQGLPIAPAVMV